jgi:preprotein translocase subunit SecY
MSEEQTKAIKELATYIEGLKLSQPVEKEIARLVNRIIKTGTTLKDIKH